MAPRASQGGTLRLFGRAMAWEDGVCVHAAAPTAVASTVLHLAGDSQSSFDIPASSASCFDATFPIPAGVPAGTYTASVSTAAAPAGFASRSPYASIPVDIVPPPPAVATTIDVDATPYNGNVSMALSHAVVVPQPVVVALGAAAYNLTACLVVPAGTTLAGKGVDASILQWASPLACGAAVSLNGTRASIQDVSVSVLTPVPQAVAALPAAANGHMARVKVNADAPLTAAPMGNALEVAAPGFTVTDSSLRRGGVCPSGYMQQTTLQVNGADDVAITGVTVDSGCNGFNLDGTSRLILEGCTFRTFAPNVSLGNGMATYQHDDMEAYGGFVARNTFEGNLPKASQSRHETFTTDGGGGAYAGGVLACDGDTITLAYNATALVPGFNVSKMSLLVLNGTGAGQWHRVASLGSDGATLRLRTPLQVCPDLAPAGRPWFESAAGASAVAIAPTRAHLAFVGNNITRGTVTQLYAMAVENVMSDNSGAHMTQDFHALHGGLVAQGECYQTGAQPAYRNEMSRNRLVSSFGVHLATGSPRCTRGPLAGFSFDGPWNFGFVLRGNSISGPITPMGAWPCGSLNITGVSSTVVVEGTEFPGCPPSGPGGSVQVTSSPDHVSVLG